MVKFLLIVIAACSVVLLFMGYLVYRKKSAKSSRSSFPYFLFNLWIYSGVIWGGYFFSVHIPGLFDITIERMVFILVLGVVAFYTYKARFDFGLSRTLEYAMFVFVVLCVVSMFVHGFSRANPDLPKPWYVFLIGYLAPFVAFFYVKNFFKTEKDYKVLFTGLFFLGVYLTFIAFCEKYGIYALIYPKYIVTEDVYFHAGRARGPFLNAAFNGVALNIGFISGIYLLEKTSGAQRVFYMFLLALFVPAIFFTQTRSVYLHFIMTVGALLFLYRTSVKKWKILPLFLCFFFFAVMLNIDRFTSADRSTGGVAQLSEVEIRFALVKKTLPLIADHPIFGIGLAQFSAVAYRAYDSWDSQHNHLIGLFAELGATGFIVYLFILGAVLRRLYLLSKHLPEDADVDENFLLLLTLSLFVVLVNNTFLEPTFSLYVSSVFFIFAGIVDRLYNEYILHRGSGAELS